MLSLAQGTDSQLVELHDLDSKNGAYIMCSHEGAAAVLRPLVTQGQQQKLGQHTSIEAAMLPNAVTPIRTESLCLSFSANAETFDTSSPKPITSSDRKHIYQGILTQPNDAHLPCSAVLFTTFDGSLYTAAASSLAHNRPLCIGPDIYELVGAMMNEGRSLP